MKENKLKRFMCKIGIHYLKNYNYYFHDVVSGKSVFTAICACGKQWMTDSKFPLTISKFERIRRKE